MKTQIFKPSRRFLSKSRLILVIVALMVLASGLLLAWLMSFDESITASDLRGVITITAICDIVWWVPAMLLTGPYYRSLSYEIQDDEVVVRAGIITQAVKHVPYRTVTNLTIKRGLLDRWFFDIGTLNIQTAGMSGTTGAEESLAGLPNVQEVYEIVATELRRFRGAMAPTAADVESEPGTAPTRELGAILAEVRAIRQVLEKD